MQWPMCMCMHISISHMHPAFRKQQARLITSDTFFAILVSSHSKITCEKEKLEQTRALFSRSIFVRKVKDQFEQFKLNYKIACDICCKF